MKNWKLLGELSAEEVKLECERANLVVKQNSSQNLVRLSKYIMTTGYDPETFYFNTLYQGNKNAPLVGMAAPGGNVQAGFSSSRTRILPLEAAPTPATSSTSAQSDESGLMMDGPLGPGQMTDRPLGPGLMMDRPLGPGLMMGSLQEPGHIVLLPTLYLSCLDGQENAATIKIC